MNRIFFVSTVEAHWGGSEVLWSAAALAARASGCAVAAYFPYYKHTPQTRQLAAAGVELFHGSAPPTRWWRRWLRPVPDRAERFRQALQRFQPELVLINQGAACDGLSEISACHAQGRRYAILNQAVEPTLPAHPRLPEIRTAFEQAAHIWCVSAENLALLRTSLGRPLSHAESVPNAYGCSFDVTCPWPAKDSPSRLAVVARLTTLQKGQDLLLEVLAAPKWRTRDLQITLFGEGEDRAQLAARSRELHLHGVHIPGHSASVGAIWEEHHALVLPSRFEGHSLAMIEAMLHGRPVIATPVGGTAGYILEGDTGFLADEISVVALDAALERAWTRRADWRRIGENAARHIRTLVAPEPGADLLKRLSLVAAATPTP